MAGSVSAPISPPAWCRHSAIRAARPETERTCLRFRDEHHFGANLYALLGPDARIKKSVPATIQPNTEA
ncbi:MAG: hypothetical protein ACREJ5_02290 [Geminicoccaceae bacterium]